MEATQWVELPFAFVGPAEVLSAGIVLPIVCLGMVATRFYLRVTQGNKIGLDYWCILLGVIFITGMGVTFIVGERMGIMGYPTPVPSGTVATEAFGLYIDAYTQEAKLQFAIQLLLDFAYGFVKTSIVLFCRRIFIANRGSFFDWASRITLVIIFLWSLSFLLALVVGCGKDVAVHWAPLKLAASGCDLSTPEVAVVISDIVLDVIIIVLPLPAIWALNMSVKRRLAVSGVFLVGLASLAASGARAAVYLTFLYAGYGAGYDIDQAATLLLWWSLLEVSLAAMAACLPSMSTLAKVEGVRSFFYSLGSMTSLSSRWRSQKSDLSNTDIEKRIDTTSDSNHISPTNSY
ncbi:hypothetical protein F4678DRAFT_431031 [Xylaria arbuscula]|nr:hypothetical protein F4678DRAFT_431031 [Xylaria arbuscula]